MELELAMTSQQAVKIATVVILENDDVENRDNCLCASDGSDGWSPRQQTNAQTAEDLAELQS